MTSSTNDQPEMPTETTESIEASSPRSRRGILAAGAAGLAGAFAASLGRPHSVEAAAGSPLIMGVSNFGGSSSTRMSATSSGGAFWMTQNGSGSGVRGDSTSGHGGVFTSAHIDRYGLYAQNNAVGDAGQVGAGAGLKAIGNYSVGVHGSSNADAGVRGITASTDVAGIEGTGPVLGVRGYASGPTGAIGVDGEGAQSGVRGSSTAGEGVNGESDSGSGVRGQSSTGHGVHGISASSYAGWFDGPVMLDGRVQMGSYADLADATIPGNPAGGARIFSRTSMGQHELCVIFPSGTIHVISSEPTAA